MSETLIHPTAVISDGAVIGSGTSVGPYSVIGPNVVIGADNKIASHVVIEGSTKIGNKNHIFQFASIGAVPQDLKFHGENSVLEIGDENIVREYVTLQPGTEGGGMKTTIGSKNLFMACSHVGHDCEIGSRNIFANSVGISGHVTIGNSVTIGGLSGLHQFIRLGDCSFLSGGTMIGKDVPPFCYAQGDRAGLAGINQVGMARNGYEKEDIRLVINIYKELFMGEGLFRERLEALVDKHSDNSTAMQMLSFISESERGVCIARKEGIES